MIKNIFFISTFLLTILFNPLKGQRYLPGQTGFQLNIGGVDNFRFLKKDYNKNEFELFEYHLYGSISWYTFERNRWGFGLQFMRRKPEEQLGKLNFYSLDQYLGDVFYWMPFFSNKRKNFFLSFGFGANFGYEHSSKDMRNMISGIELTEKELKKTGKINNRFLYGAFIGLEAEVFLTNRFIFILNTKARYLRKSFIKDFQFNYGAGFKYILNY